MTGSSTFIGYNGCGDLHHRFPVGIRHIGNQDFTFFEILDILDGFNDVDLSRSDFRSDACARDNGGTRFKKDVTFQNACILLRFYSFRPGLQDEQISGDPVLAPLNVHGLVIARLLRIMILDNGRPARQSENFLFRNAEALPFFRYGGNDLRRFIAAGGVNHLDFFGSELFLKDGSESLLQSRLENIKFIRIDDSLNDRLSQSVGSRYKNGILESRFRVNGENNA
ncbi:MAG: hypothetical protein A4E72_01463 [Syntrophus sp. PtaU1.Bin208]|nr:MAG: hypothetical protein A4E72_01463 [Syntrophus sp. PtaU1.Bin208]